MDDIPSVDIRGTDAAYRQAVSALSNDLRARQVAPFLGAGISRGSPSNLCVANDLQKPLHDALWESSRSMRDALRPDEVKAHATLVGSRLERLLDALWQVYGDGALSYLDVLNSRHWNPNHAAVAELAGNGLLPWCVTLNFDLLIERAVTAAGKACRTVCPLVGRTFASGKGDPCLDVVKPHGSFVPADAGGGPYDCLSATLSQIGSLPAKPNQEAIEKVVASCPVLLVGGYSDNDWDVFPIVSRLGRSRIRKVLWVQHNKNEALPFQVERLLRGRADSLLLFGPFDVLMRDVLSECGLPVPAVPSGSGAPPPPDATRFSPLAGEGTMVRTAVALAMLLQHTGQFSELLLNWLHSHPVVEATPDLLWRVRYLLCHTEHTRGRLGSAIRYMRSVIETKESAGGCGRAPTTAKDTLWLGYEHLCLTKRPNPLRPSSIIAVPFHVLRGLFLLEKAVRRAARRERYPLLQLARYYRVDLLHAWANILMLAGPRFIPLCKPAFRGISALYRRLDGDSLLAQGEHYYWQRHLEARILAGEPTGTDDDKRLDEIEYSNRLVQNNVQIGNTYAYRALMRFMKSRKMSRRVKKLMRKAARKWGEDGKDIRSGHGRLLLFRRFMGMVSLRQAIVGFLSR